MNTLGVQIGVVVIVAGAAAGWIKSREVKAVSTERARVEAKSNANAQKAETARRSVDRIPSERLLDKWCRDCR